MPMLRLYDGYREHDTNRPPSWRAPERNERETTNFYYARSRAAPLQPCLWTACPLCRGEKCCHTATGVRALEETPEYISLLTREIQLLREKLEAQAQELADLKLQEWRRNEPCLREEDSQRPYEGGPLHRRGQEGTGNIIFSPRVYAKMLEENYNFIYWRPWDTSPLRPLFGIWAPEASVNTSK